VTIKVFANSDLADEWLVVNEPEGVVFEYEVSSGAENGATVSAGRRLKRGVTEET
jgi:hypothetical protein